MNLEHAHVLVTGGSSGIGLETARLLKAKGARVAICGRREGPLHEAAKITGAIPIVGDVSKAAEARHIVSEAARDLGGYDTLINNAAYGYFAPLAEVDLAKFEAMMAVNLTGAMLMARESVPHFVAASTGNIVNIGSTAAGRGFAGGTAYCASKFALTGMTECWRTELRKHNVRVMQVNPSEVQTHFAATAGYDQKLSERKLQSIDIATVICDLLSLEDRGFVTDTTVWATNPD
jgi:3-oxoacyl-[acyl-carrier protein] reductase